MTGEEQRPRWRIGFTLITVALSTGLSLLGIGSVLTVSLLSAGENTQALIHDRTATILTTTLDRFQQLVGSVREAMNDVAVQIASGRLDVDNEAATQRYFSGILAAAPHIREVALLRATLQVESFARDDEARLAPLPETFARKALDQADRATGPWFVPGWSDRLHEPVLSLVTPVRVPDTGSTALLLPRIALGELGERVAELARQLRQTVFIIYDRGYVVAHSRAPEAGATRHQEKPLLTLAEYGDPVLAQIWRAGAVLVPTGEFGLNIGARRLAAPGGDYNYIYHMVDAGNGHTFTIGTYYRGSLAEAEVARLRQMVMAGLATLLLVIVATIVAGRRVSRPILALAAAAEEIEKQKFEEFQPLPRTRIRELDVAGQAFHQMVIGLRERLRIRTLFGKYVPNEVVEQLLANPQEVSLGGERREVSLLFTDIAGFTTLSEKLAPETVLNLLNAYFEGLAHCIRPQGGIIVDFNGDAAFAIFNAPVSFPDHARRALTSAHAIDRFVQDFAAEWGARGIPIGKTRIGVHTGVATVGNMGAHDRMKFSAAGDVVNTASRLEGANKLFNTKILASGESIRQAGDLLCRPVGQFVLKGRTAALDVFELLSDDEAAGDWLAQYRLAFDAMEHAPARAQAAFLRLLQTRPDDGVIRFYLDRLDSGLHGVVIELTEK